MGTPGNASFTLARSPSLFLFLFLSHHPVCGSPAITLTLSDSLHEQYNEPLLEKSKLRTGRWRKVSSEVLRGPNGKAARSTPSVGPSTLGSSPSPASFLQHTARMCMHAHAQIHSDTHLHTDIQIQTGTQRHTCTRTHTDTHRHSHT